MLKINQHGGIVLAIDNRLGNGGDGNDLRWQGSRGMIAMAGEMWGTRTVMLMLGMRMAVMVTMRMDDDGNLGILMETGIFASLSDL